MAWTVFSLFIALVFIGGFLIYKVKYGFPVRFETLIPEIEFPKERKIKVLLFSKTTGFRHDASIDAGKKAFSEMAVKNDWFLYETEAGGVFNEEQLPKFDVVIFNNSTGRVLNDEQQQLLENYVEEGGMLLGIHGAGDDSHRWDWYEENLIGAKFSHHPIKNQIQETDLFLEPDISPSLKKGLPDTWAHADEWYVFFSNPRIQGFRIVYTIDGEKIDPDGNFFLIRSKNFGMGKDHPVAWYKNIVKGKTFYTSIGHDASAWEHDAFIQMLENAVKWSVE
ncbi:ThuA domain-containing protein [Cecembia lonarensis]|uniref:Cytochrome c551/c552 n=1 Tax=Cecembia lonarensis (strain CCUG 58316 / KCTC 22772 / LW9) TaxID=1225176 RepID=K1L8H9_CECL9|nr:ThuA domain-containing protein [Cecembia lonarensis]EKB48492.1 Cytochrome c551/c552 [Cecembia lonarensis LW9]